MKKILIFGANSDIAIEFVRLFNQGEFKFYLCSKNYEQLKKNYNHIKQKTLINLDIEKAHTFKDFLNKIDNDIGFVITFIGYKEKNEINIRKIFKINFFGQKKVINYLLNKKNFPKISNISCITSIVADKKNYKESAYSYSKFKLSKYLLNIKTDNDCIVKNYKLGMVRTKMIKDIKYYKFLAFRPSYVAKKIYYDFGNSQKEIYIPYFWKYIVGVFNLLPFKIMSKIDNFIK